MTKVPARFEQILWKISEVVGTRFPHCGGGFLLRSSWKVCGVFWTTLPGEKFPAMTLHANRQYQQGYSGNKRLTCKASHFNNTALVKTINNNSSQLRPSMNAQLCECLYTDHKTGCHRKQAIRPPWATMLCMYSPNASCNLQNFFIITLGNKCIISYISDHMHTVNMLPHYLIKYLTALWLSRTVANGLLYFAPFCSYNNYANNNNYNNNNRDNNNNITQKTNFQWRLLHVWCWQVSNTLKMYTTNNLSTRLTCVNNTVKSYNLAALKFNDFARKKSSCFLSRKLKYCLTEEYESNMTNTIDICTMLIKLFRMIKLWKWGTGRYQWFTVLIVFNVK